jgi:hypothetical protein
MYAQLTHVLATGIAVNALIVGLFLGREQESCSLAASIIAFISVVCGSLITTGSRILFRRAYLHGHANVRYVTNKKKRDAVRLSAAARLVEAGGWWSGSDRSLIGSGRNLISQMMRQRIKVLAAQESSANHPSPVAASRIASDPLGGGAVAGVPRRARMQTPQLPWLRSTLKAQQAASTEEMSVANDLDLSEVSIEDSNSASPNSRVGRRTLMHSTETPPPSPPDSEQCGEGDTLQLLAIRSSKKLDAPVDQRPSTCTPEKTLHCPCGTVEVLSMQLALADSDDGRIGLHVWAKEQAKSEGRATFVAARHICRQPFVRTLTVRYALADVPPGCAKFADGGILHGNITKKAHAQVGMFGEWSYELVAAWLVNIALLWSSCLMLLYIYAVRSLLAQNLQGSTRDDEQWRSDFMGALSLNLLFSFLVFDMVKVFCLTLTSKAFLVSVLSPSNGDVADAPLGKGRCSPLVRLIVRVLRRAHKVLDWLC